MSHPEANPRAGLGTYVDFCRQHIETLVREVGPRPPGSEEELRAQRYLAGLLEPVADEVDLEPFTLSPKAFMGFVPISGGLLVAAAVLLSWAPGAALLAVAGAVGLLVGELVLYRPVVDAFFPRATSHNLIARLRPRGPTKQILLFGGHCDSAWEWRWHYLGRAAFLSIVGGALVGAVVALAASVAALAAPGSKLAAWLGSALWLFAPFFVLVMGFTNFRRCSPGANDNLTGVLLSIALAKQLRESGADLEHTEIRILNTGAEEAGLRGARAYAERHRRELEGTPSLYVALDTFRDLEHMAVYDRDRNGTVQHDRGAAELLARAAREAGLSLPFHTIPVGATDAAAFTQAGLRAIALVAMDPAPPRWYHTRLDTPDLLRPECLEAGLRVMGQLVRIVEAEGLGPETG